MRKSESIMSPIVFVRKRHGTFELMKNIKLSLRGACLRATWQSQQMEIISRDAHVRPWNFLSITI